VRRNTIHVLVVGAIVAVATGWAPTAEAQSRTRISQPFGGTRPLQLDLHAGFAWRHDGFATGVRFGIPIVHNGFVPSINNAVYINFGGDLYFNRGDHLDLGLPVTMHWEFYFTEHWSAFGEAGLNVYLHLDDRGDNDFDFVDWFIAAVGGRFWFNESIAITLRVGSPYVAFGVTFAF
jgi:hypothetical protein